MTAMLAEVPPLVPTLSSLAYDANVELAAIDANDADSLQRAIRAGEYLNQAKTLCPLGQWQTWTAENLACSRAMAIIYMRIARHKSEVAGFKTINAAKAWLIDVYGDSGVRGDNNSQRTDLVIAREAKARELRDSGMLLREIADELGIAQSTVSTLLNRAHYQKRARENAARRRKEAATAKKALARENERAAVKRCGGQPEVIYTSILKACESAGRMIEETPERKAAADAILVDLYRAKDKILALIGTS